MSTEEMMLQIVEKFAHIEEMNTEVYAKREARERVHLEETEGFKVGDDVTTKLHKHREDRPRTVYTIVAIYRRDGIVVIEGVIEEGFVGHSAIVLVPQLWEHYAPEDLPKIVPQ